MRKIMLGVIVLLALLLAAEVGVTLLSQKGLERALRSQYGLPQSLEVSINSFPFLLSLARNHIAELQLSWDGEFEYQVEEGSLYRMPYSGRISIYDIELNMPSLLTGKLEVRDLSRMKATIAVDIASVNDALGFMWGGFYIDGGRLYVGEGDDKTRLKVKASTVNTITVEPYDTYSRTGDIGQNPDPQVYTMTVHGLPMGAELKNASLDGSSVVLEISVPMWEGYL